MILFSREGTLNTCSIHGATREKALLRKENFRTSQHIQNKRNQSALQIPRHEGSNSEAQQSELKRIIVKCGCVQTWEALCGKYVYSSQQKQQKENTHQNSIPHTYIYKKTGVSTLLSRNNHVRDKSQTSGCLHSLRSRRKPYLHQSSSLYTHHIQPCHPKCSHTV